MQKSFRAIAATALIGLGLCVWWVFFPGAGRIIRARVAELAQTVSFKPSDGTIPKGIKIMKLPDFFTTDVVIKLEARGFETQNFSGREEIRDKAPLLYGGLRGLQVEFLDVKLTFGPDRQTAIAHLTGKATVSGERDYYVQELDLMFKKVDGKWLIYRVETVKTLTYNESL
jgi:hypothetical protein